MYVNTCNQALWNNNLISYMTDRPDVTQESKCLT